MNRIRISVTYLYFTGLLLIFTVACTGTSSSDEMEKVYLLEELDVAPEFPGGYDEFINYLIKRSRQALPALLMK
jgi:hypothetical protein